MEQIEHPERKWTIGIDPGKDTGFAVYDRHAKEITTVKTLDFWSCYHHFVAAKPTAHMFIVVIEAPVKNAMYARQESAQAAHGGGKRYGNAMMSAAAGNAHEAALLADGIEALGFEVRRMRPKRRNFKTAEEDRAHVKKITGYKGASNPHTRDAIMLCWGI